MKQVYLILIFLITAATASSQYYIYTANKSSSWNDISMWNMAVRGDGVPKTKVVIPAGLTVNVDNAVNSFGLGNAEITLHGTLNIISNTNINLGPASVFEIQGAGKITGSNNTQKISIGGVTKYDGSKDLTKTGGWIATSTTGISPLGFVSTLVLPVDMLSFNITKSDKQNNLKWITASEVSNDYFQVERSYDGTTWSSIGSVKGMSNSNTNTSYTFSDKNATASTVFYRLKQVDTKGSFTYSEVKKISGTAGNIAKVYMVDNSIRVELANVTTENTVVTVLQSGGNLIARKAFNDGKALKLDVKSNTTGIVFVNITDNKQLNQTVKLFL